MNEILNTFNYPSLLAYAMTYLLHSTAWILLVALLVKTPFFQTPLLKNYLWKVALLGGLTTCSIASFYGNDFFKIQITEPVIQEFSVIENSTNEIVLEKPFEKDHAAQIVSYQKETKLTAPSSPVLKPDFTLSKYLPLLLMFWLIGSLILGLKMVGEHWSFFKKINPKVAVKNSETIAVFQKIKQKANLIHSIKLTQSSTLDSPILIRNQEICLPEKAIFKLEKAQLEAMLAHEMAHIARKDYHWTIGLSILEVIFFFQPLHYWAKKEINNTNELLCDARAAQITGNNLALAQCLLTVATWIQDQPRNYALVAGMSLKKSELSNRVTSLIQFSNGDRSGFSIAKIILLFSTLLAITLVLLPAFSFTEDIDSTTPTLSENIVSKITESQKENIVEIKKEVPIIIEKVPAKTPDKFHHLTAEKFESLSSQKKDCAYLLAAVKSNNLSKVKRLLETADPDCMFCGSDSPSAPINAAAQNANVKIVQLLLEAGGDIYNRSYHDEGALIAAARNGNIPIMKLLDDYGAYFDHEFKGYGTVLTTAINYNQYEMVKYLLNHNADPMKELNNGKTAVHYAQAKGGKIGSLVSGFTQNTSIATIQN